ncbi:MAG: membrane protein of unknown function [Promethearchaeota archaeon]|nr:MAG: membrane protein of unknown function [Candidatus Lokiarchaeota archaeon]
MNKLSKILIVFSSISLLSGVGYQLTRMVLTGFEWQGYWDLLAYNYFVESFPKLYYGDGSESAGYYAFSVFYLPYFSLIWLPLSYVNVVYLWFVITALSIVSSGYIIFISKKIDDTAHILILLLFIITGWDLLRWGNIEIIIAGVFFFYWNKIKNQNYTLKAIDIFLLSFLSFKVVTFVFILLLLVENDRKQIGYHFFYVILSQIIFNLYFVFLLYDDFLSYFSPSDLWAHPMYDEGLLVFLFRSLFRITLSFPFFYLLIKTLKFIEKSRKGRVSLFEKNYQNEKIENEFNLRKKDKVG